MLTSILTKNYKKREEKETDRLMMKNVKIKPN